jgi:hypothetical protein
MTKYADKSQENVNQPAANAQKQTGEAVPTFPMVDNRAQAIAQRKLQALALNSPKAKQHQALQKMTDNSQKTKQGYGAEGTRGEGDMIQFYREEKAKKPQKGTFIPMSSVAVHLHIGINKKNHLKINSHYIYISPKGGNYEANKIQEALDQLLDHKQSIDNDKTRSPEEKDAIADCIEWLVEKGATMPALEAPEKEEKEAVAVAAAAHEDTGAAGDYYGRSEVSNNNAGNAEEDFW